MNTLARRAPMVLMVFVFSMCICTSAVVARTMTAEESIARAEQVSAAVGWVKAGQEGPKREAAVAEVEGQPGSCEVRIGDAYVELDVLTGKVIGARRWNALGRRSEDVINLSESLANRQAERYLKAAGVSFADLMLEKSAPHSACASPGAMLWHIQYRRMCGAYPFFADGLEVDLDPLDGSFIGFGDSRRSPVPVSTDVKLSEAEACEKGRLYLAEFAMTAGEAKSSKLYVVQPNDMYEHWEVHSPAPPEITCSRLAWVVEYGAPWESTSVFVDAQTGAVLGGTVAGMPKNVVLAPVVGIESVSLEWGASRDTIPMEKEGRALVKQLRALKPSAIPKCGVPIKIVLASQKRCYTFGYSPDRHCLSLLTKRYDGKTISGRLAWETTKEFEDLIAKYLPH